MRVNLGRSVDAALLGWRWGATPVGLFGNARRLMQLPLTQLNAPVTQVALPALSRIALDPERYRAAYLRLLDKLLLLAVPGVACLIAMADWFVALLLGPQWTESGRLFAILGIAALVEPVCGTAGWLLVSQGRSREMLLAGACDAALRFGLVAIALPWGAMGVAVAVVLRLGERDAHAAHRPSPRPRAGGGYREGARRARRGVLRGICRGRRRAIPSTDSPATDHSSTGVIV